MGAVSKYAGDCKIIYDLLVPSDLRTNNFVVPNSYSLTYCSVDDAYTTIKQRGKGALLSPLNLQIIFKNAGTENAKKTGRKILSTRSVHSDGDMDKRFGFNGLPHV